MNSPSHVNILIATPGRNMEAEYVVSLVNTIKYLNENHITYMFLNQYSSQVSAARESTIMNSRLLSAFETRPLSGRVTYDKIIWIDSDISWTIEDFIKIYKSDLDIISGIYFNEEGVPMISINKDDMYYSPEYLVGKQYPFEVFGVGFGFLAVKSGVFENIPRPWFDTVFEKVYNEDKTKEMYIPYGEDYSWCKKAHDAGYKIYADPSIRLGHHKKVRIQL